MAGSSETKGGGKPLDHVADLVMEQALTLYRYWPDMFLSEFPV